MPASEALSLFEQLGNGQFSHDDRCFFPTNEALGPVTDCIGLLHCAGRKVIRGCEGEADTTLFLVEGTVAAVVCGKRLRVPWRRRTGTQCMYLTGLRPQEVPRAEESKPDERCKTLKSKEVR